MLTLEWASGVNLGDVQRCAPPASIKTRLSERVIQTFLTHALRDGFFHADMHQGTLGPDGALVAYDFGIMGRIDAYTRRVYAEILIGFLHRDYHRVAEVHFEAGYVPRDRDTEAFAQALLGRRADLRPGRHAHLDGAAARAPLRGDRALRMQDRADPAAARWWWSRGRSLNPAMNMWETARPVVTDYIRTNLGPAAVARDLASAVRILSRFGPRLPQMAEALLIRASTPPLPLVRIGPPAWAYALAGARRRRARRARVRL